MKYVLTGGGTGGHIYPALAIAKEIQRQDKDAEILYIGTEKGLEADLVPKAGLKFKTVRVKGLPRKINKDFFKSIWELLNGLREANRIIKDFKPDYVIGTGGYVSGPVVLMGVKNKAKTLIHEQNAYPGLTNKILARFVDRVAVTFEDSVEYFKKQEKIIVTGNPIRSEILTIEKEEAYKKLNIGKDKPLVLSFGGSGGQYRLNNAIIDILKKEKIEDFQLIHVTGKRLHEDFMSKLEDKSVLDNKNIHILSYLHDMPEALNIADLVIASSGAITLAEISAIGLASILIPKSYTAENHQEYNARAFEDAGASKIILEKDLEADLLYRNIVEIIDDRSKLDDMADRSRKLGNTKATEDIVRNIMNLS